MAGQSSTLYLPCHLCVNAGVCVHHSAWVEINAGVYDIQRCTHFMQRLGALRSDVMWVMLADLLLPPHWGVTGGNYVKPCFLRLLFLTPHLLLFRKVHFHVHFHFLSTYIMNLYTTKVKWGLNPRAGENTVGQKFCFLQQPVETENVCERPRLNREQLSKTHTCFSASGEWNRLLQVSAAEIRWCSLERLSKGCCQRWE